MNHLLTSGQAARKLRISISTLKRWLDNPGLTIPDKRNYNGWRLFSEADIEKIKRCQREIKKVGKQFKEDILIPVNTPDSNR